MTYVEVATEKLVIKNQRVLTYSSTLNISIGDVVRVPLGRNYVNGIVLKKVSKPEFKTKEIESVLYPNAFGVDLIKTMLWMESYYACELPQIIQTVLPRGLDKTRRDTYTPPKKVLRLAEPDLTTQQKIALKKLSQNPVGTVLLHGVTGSGKTRIYIEQAKMVIKQNKSVIVLVPEIGLTSQLVQEFSKHFSGVFVVHSSQTESERHLTWEAINKAPNPIVIGPRSALFCPINNLGLIVIDEEHENSYKQDRSPKYNAVRVASVLAQSCKAQLILGSATPSIEDYYLASSRNMPIVTIDKPILKSGLNRSEVTVIDIKNKSAFSPRSRLFSTILLNHMEEALRTNKQVLLFHNRRGTASLVICTACGWVANCPACSLPLTFHKDKLQMVCHICGFKGSAPYSCPECKKPELRFKGYGTKEIVDEASKLFPSAKIARFDGDLAKSEQLENRYEELKSGHIDIIIGTQMIAKGLDLPNVVCVGVVLADTSLFLPDFSASERTFQLLYQVIGRAGRSGGGNVDIQTYSPNNPAIKMACKRDYQAFYDYEIKERKQSGYPPFRHLLVIEAERATQNSALKAIQNLKNSLKIKDKSIEVLGPSPAFHEQRNNKFRWQIVLKASKRKDLIDVASNLPVNYQSDLDPANLL